MRRDVAEELNQITIDCSAMMGRALQIVKTVGDRDEMENYLRNIAEVLAAITMLAAPIYAEYPDLTPPQLRDDD
jgi:hypothetical protein